jgi:outer membrane protein OmpA-like peptidoglycan-associated protein
MFQDELVRDYFNPAMQLPAFQLKFVSIKTRHAWVMNTNFTFWKITVIVLLLALFQTGCSVNKPPGAFQPAKKGMQLTFHVVHSEKNDLKPADLVPLRNYVFFDKGSVVIPKRYVLLTKEQAKNFHEEQVEDFQVEEIEGCSLKQMELYYNVLNIIADRIRKNPASSVILSGSSENGIEEGRLMSASIRDYFILVFDIDPSRIIIEDGSRPTIPSGHPGGTCELDHLREENRRVAITINSESLMTEFGYARAGEKDPREKPKADSLVAFFIEGSPIPESWSITLKDKKGNALNFGPYSELYAYVPVKYILGGENEGKYLITLHARLKSGKKINMKIEDPLILHIPLIPEEELSYSMLFEFNQTKPVSIYEKYLNEVFIPKIPNGSLIIIHGHQDLIGGEAHNLRLPLERANEAKRLIEKGIGNKNIKFEVYGFAEDEAVSATDNTLPETRYYGRTVLIRVIPAKYVLK